MLDSDGPVSRKAGIELFRMDTWKQVEGPILLEPTGKGEVNLLESGGYECPLIASMKIWS